MITEKFTPLQIRRMERAIRIGRKEKRRIAEVSTHRSCYRWSNDWRHELRAYNAESKKDRFWERIEMCESAEGNFEEAIERELMAEVALERAKQFIAAKRAEALELAICLEKSFGSEEFVEKLLEDVE